MRSCSRRRGGVLLTAEVSLHRAVALRPHNCWAPWSDTRRRTWRRLSGGSVCISEEEPARNPAIVGRPRPTTSWRAGLTASAGVQSPRGARVWRRRSPNPPRVPHIAVVAAHVRGRRRPLSVEPHHLAATFYSCLPL